MHFHAQRALDTIETDAGKVVLYSNKTWAFLQISNFDGVMNPQIHQYMLAHNPSYKHPWSNDVCFTSRNDLSKLKDTILIHLNDANSSNFFMPTPGVVTSRYGTRNGRNHNGIDLDLETGDTVYAAWSGKVRYAKYNDGGYGNLVIIRHPNGLETLYGHLSKFLVYPDQEIVMGLRFFDHNVDNNVADYRLVNDLLPLSLHDYQVKGSTALLDAIGKSIYDIKTRFGHQITNEDTSVVMIIITDGHENASRMYTYEDIRRMVSELEATEKCGCRNDL